MVAGDGDLDSLGEEGWSFSASSRVTFATQRIGLATAVADAMMVEALVARDVLRAAPPAPLGTPCAGSCSTPVRVRHGRRRGLDGPCSGRREGAWGAAHGKPWGGATPH